MQRRRVRQRDAITTQLLEPEAPPFWPQRTKREDLIERPKFPSEGLKLQTSKEFSCSKIINKRICDQREMCSWKGDPNTGRCIDKTVRDEIRHEVILLAKARPVDEIKKAVDDINSEINSKPREEAVAGQVAQKNDETKINKIKEALRDTGPGYPGIFGSDDLTVNWTLKDWLTFQKEAQNIEYVPAKYWPLLIEQLWKGKTPSGEAHQEGLEIVKKLNEETEIRRQSNIEEIKQDLEEMGQKPDDIYTSNWTLEDWETFEETIEDLKKVPEDWGLFIEKTWNGRTPSGEATQQVEAKKIKVDEELFDEALELEYQVNKVFDDEVNAEYFEALTDVATEPGIIANLFNRISSILGNIPGSIAAITHAIVELVHAAQTYAMGDKDVLDLIYEFAGYVKDLIASIIRGAKTTAEIITEFFEKVNMWIDRAKPILRGAHSVLLVLGHVTVVLLKVLYVLLGVSFNVSKGTLKLLVRFIRFMRSETYYGVEEEGATRNERRERTTPRGIEQKEQKEQKEEKGGKYRRKRDNLLIELQEQAQRWGVSGEELGEIPYGLRKGEVFKKGYWGGGGSSHRRLSRKSRRSQKKRRPRKRRLSRKRRRSRKRKR